MSKASDFFSSLGINSLSLILNLLPSDFVLKLSTKLLGKLVIKAKNKAGDKTINIIAEINQIGGALANACNDNEFSNDDAEFVVSVIKQTNLYDKLIASINKVVDTSDEKEVKPTKAKKTTPRKKIEK